ncbi:GmrSD restriction endonuclease domain-containing protein [Companilactobacillus muriivasis]|uniref:GmrSD restriction endonuclease domain-containing protein n=1 Tax=Companilactobacillus muriivasis TaxID=3081444 RepID=UPI0030C6E2D0
MNNIESRKYRVQNTSVGTLLNWISSGEIGLPELQRPFVWSSVKVRDFIDSLYNGFPVGYIITWNNPSIHLKDGSISTGKKIMIDGQQRVTALRAAIAGEKVMNSKFQYKRIRISFNPIEEKFQTFNGAIAKDPQWIPDISVLFSSEFHEWDFIPTFAKNSGTDPNDIAEAVKKILQLINNDIGNIELDASLPIESVTEIFNRINSKGTELSTADFIMSKLSSDTEHDGNNIRKCVEYFSRLLADPLSIDSIANNDKEFLNTEYFSLIKWAKNENSNLYNPRFGDLFHVVLGFEFGRGKHSDLVSLISGREFKSRTFTAEAMSDAYTHLKHGVEQMVNQSNFERYIMILKSLGMCDNGVLGLNGMGVLNFGYSLYLFLKNKNDLSESEIESIVKRWVVMSALTNRYSGSSESKSEMDIKLFINDDPQEIVDRISKQELSDDFWNVTLPNKLETSSTAANVWRIFQMSQVRANDLAWLEKDHRVSSLIENQGNVHHIFPKAYLKAKNFSQQQYNQVANYTWLTQPRNLLISDKAPQEYLHDTQVTEFMSDESFEKNAIPKELMNYDFNDYNKFLENRRHLMSLKIKQYFTTL